MIKIGDKIQSYHRGKARTGTVTKECPKTTARKAERHVYVKWDGLEGYGSASIKPVRLLFPPTIIEGKGHGMGSYDSGYMGGNVDSAF